MRLTTLGTLTVVSLIGLAACATQSGATADESPSATPRATAEDPTPGPGEMEITGVLDSEAIEGGCPHLRAEDDTRYEVLWPEGWELDPATLELSNPDGEVVAEAGDELTLHGRIAEDVASICMIGPIFGATTVIVPD